jgi:hypothetical protein
MDKLVILQFKNRFEIIEFRSTIGLAWYDVNLDELILTSPLSDKEVELALNNYNAELVTGSLSTGDDF